MFDKIANEMDQRSEMIVPKEVLTEIKIARIVSSGRDFDDGGEEKHFSAS